MTKACPRLALSLVLLVSACDGDPATDAGAGGRDAGEDGAVAPVDAALADAGGASGGCDPSAGGPFTVASATGGGFDAFTLTDTEVIAAKRVGDAHELWFIPLPCGTPRVVPLGSGVSAIGMTSQGLVVIGQEGLQLQRPGGELETLERFAVARVFTANEDEVFFVGYAGGSRDVGLYAVALTDGTARQVTADGLFFSEGVVPAVAAGRDGLYVSAPDGVYRVPYAGGAPQRVSSTAGHVEAIGGRVVWSTIEGVFQHVEGEATSARIADCEEPADCNGPITVNAASIREAFFSRYDPVTATVGTFRAALDAPTPASTRMNDEGPTTPFNMSPTQVLVNPGRNLQVNAQYLVWSRSLLSDVAELRAQRLRP